MPWYNYKQSPSKSKENSMVYHEKIMYFVKMCQNSYQFSMISCSIKKALLNKTTPNYTKSQINKGTPKIILTKYIILLVDLVYYQVFVEFYGN